jgi:hypothetical protein
MGSRLRQVVGGSAVTPPTCGRGAPPLRVAARPHALPPHLRSSPDSSGATPHARAPRSHPALPKLSSEERLARHFLIHPA